MPENAQNIYIMEFSEFLLSPAVCVTSLVVSVEYLLWSALAIFSMKFNYFSALYFDKVEIKNFKC